MAKTIFEEMGGTYEMQGDYLIPCIALPPEKEQTIGLFGQRHKRYLKQFPTPMIFLIGNILSRL